MNPIDAKVEIRFDGSTWVDVTDVSGVNYLVQSAGISITRGRDSETGDAVSAGTCSFTLQNDDGRFSPDLPSSPYFPNVAEGVAVRVSAYANSAWRTRFYGTIQSWDTGPDGPDATTGTTVVTANDTLATLSSYTFRQAADEVIRHTPGVIYHWPLRTLSGDDVALVGDVPLIDNGGTGSVAGGLLPLDEGTDPHPVFKSSTGERIMAAASLPLISGSPWELRFVLFAAPTNPGPLLAFANLGGLSWSPTYGLYATDYLGNNYPPTDSAMPTAYPSVVRLQSTGRVTCCALGGTPQPVAASVNMLTLGDVGQRLTINPDLTFGHEFSVGHFVIINPAITGTYAAEQAALSAWANSLLGPRVPMSGDAASAVSAWAAGPTITGGTVGASVIPPLEGRSAGDVIAALVTGMGARLVDSLDGTIRWVPFSDTTTPTAFPPDVVDPALRWRTDSAGWLSDVTVTWPDGSTYTASRPDGKRQSGAIEGVRVDHALDRLFADWLVNASNSGARLPLAPFGLASLTEAQKQTLCEINPGSRVTLSNLPPQMPSALICFCEGLDEAISDVSWDITFKLSPDPRFVLAHPTSGVLGSSYRLFPSTL